MPAGARGYSHDLMIGETVIAVGNPFGFQHTVTTGVISALNRRMPTSEQVEISGAIQTDAAINQGNSGGPLLNINGELIGINTTIVTPSGGSAGLGFAIPAARVTKMIKRVLFNIVELEDLMGINGITNLPSLAQKYIDVPDTGGRGLLVRDLDAKGYAAQAGLRPADVVVDINQHPVADLEAYRAVVAGVTGNRIHLGFVRKEPAGAKHYDVEFSYPADALTSATAEAMQVEKAPATLDWLGLRVGAMEAEAARALGGPAADGVVVLKVTDGSSAFGVVRPGDVVVFIEEEPIHDLTDFRAAMGRHNDDARVRVGLVRNGQKRTVELKRS